MGVGCFCNCCVVLSLMVIMASFVVSRHLKTGFMCWDTIVKHPTQCLYITHAALHLLATARNVNTPAVASQV